MKRRALDCCKNCSFGFFLGAAIIAAVQSQAQTIIGSNALVATAKSAEYSLAVSLRPGDGETVYFNPPIFTWFYHTNHLVGGEQNPNGFSQFYTEWTNAFQFQVSTDAAFTNLVVDVSTLFNSYNFLAPFDTNATRTFYWRVQYAHAGSTYWTNGPYSFTVANGATNWDRSMLADTNYLATNSVHPMYCFRAGQEAQIFAYEQTNAFNYWQLLTNRAIACTNQAYFTNGGEWNTNATPNPTQAVWTQTDWGTRISDLGAVLNLWTFSRQDSWTNAGITALLVTNLQHFCNWYSHPSNNIHAVDYGQPAGSPMLVELLTATYDWMFNYCGTDTSTEAGKLRTNALYGIQKTLRIYNWNNFLFAFPRQTGAAIYDYQAGYQWGLGDTYDGYTFNEGAAHYTNIWIVQSASWPKLPNSHGTMDTHVIMQSIAAAQQEGGPAGFAFNWMFDYMLARTTPYAGFAAHHVGPYGYVQEHTPMMFRALAVLDIAYPEAKIYNTEFCRRFPEWWTRLTPPQMRKLHGPYGDGAPLTWDGHAAFWGDPHRGLLLAGVARSGEALQQYNVNANRYDPSAESTVQFTFMPLLWHYKDVLPTAVTNTTANVYAEDGYVAASSLSPSLINCYTQGVGFSIQARPRGTGMGHDTASDLSVDLWAYGAQITDGGGAGLDDYGYVAASSPTLFVNGSGPYDGGVYGNGQYHVYLDSPATPTYGRILAFTNSSTNFVYCAVDGTAFWTNNNAPDLLRTNVMSVHRHVLFPRSKYWVIYDDFKSLASSTFAFRWHVPWCFRYDAGDTPITGEHRSSANLFVSNSLALHATGFDYTAGNYATATFTDPPRIAVHVFFGTTNQGVFVATGTNGLGTAITQSGVNGTTATNSTLNPFVANGRIWATTMPDRAAGLWVTNTAASTNWHFLTVIVPQEPGKDAPTFARLDDNTVAVTYDSVTETNTFGTNYSGAYTYRVDLASGGSNPAPPQVTTHVRMTGGSINMSGPISIR